MLFLGVVFLALLPGRAFAQNYIQWFEHGRVDWSNGIIEVFGMGIPPCSQSNPAQRRALAKKTALNSGREYLLDLVEELRVDSKTTVGGLMDQEVSLEKRIWELLYGARVVDICYLPGCAVRVTMAVPLTGSFAASVLPDNIRKIEPVRQPGSPPPPKDGDVTGVVVDCRGMEVSPALAPRIMDEDGNIVYGSAYVSRDHAVANGMAAYVQGLETAAVHARTGENPLVVTGMRTVEKSATDIVVSNADAARIRSSPANLVLLQRCRVTILLD
jgi:hypothetical protein